MGGLADLLQGLGGQQGGGGGGKKKAAICPAEKIAVPKPLKKLKPGTLIANGCGPQGMVMKEPYGLWRCCNRHDVCYSSCGASFDFCEKKFKQCTQERCKQPENAGQEAECMEQANSMLGLTGIFGKDFHSNSARTVCECVDSESEAQQRRREWVVDVYERFGDPVKASNETFINSLLEKNRGKEGKLVFDLITKYGGKPGFVQFNDIPNTFELLG
eukprot:CAMPEP_0178387746 /NCGR_PEP_ID=MMETSP0689_2-20121128/9231_1 /TAXON_ID=160604 /ORGANISM="Amphidinium massartii, Strain CS-259" /LENGTH=215 /DNA_ID=CAMNT_0020008117 /DNA_START=12 /DNA_END=655 /DNA_ORIENTATION=+